MLQEDPESLHFYLRTHFLPDLTNNCDIRFYLPRLRPEGTYSTMSFSKPSLDDDQPKSLVGIQGHFSSERPCSDRGEAYGHRPHCIFTAIATPSFIALCKKLQSQESGKGRALMWRTWAPGRARFIIRHGLIDDGAQIVGMKAICRLSPPPYEFGFPKEVEKMVRLRYGQPSLVSTDEGHSVRGMRCTLWSLILTNMIGVTARNTLIDFAPVHRQAWQGHPSPSPKTMHILGSSHKRRTVALICSSSTSASRIPEGRQSSSWSFGHTFLLSL